MNRLERLRQREKQRVAYKELKLADPSLPSLEDYMDSLQVPPEVPTLEEHMASLTKPPPLLPPIPLKEMSQRDRLRIKNEGLEDLPRLIPPVIYSLPVDYSSPGIGNITFPSGLVLTGSWTSNQGIHRLDKVTNPTRKINIMDILPVIREESIVNHLFYSA